MTDRPRPTGREVTFGEDEIIVSKTDPQGRITYCNDVFIRIAGYPESRLIGAPHSIIRHPDMPRAVFKLLWDRLQAEQEVFAYVLNLSSAGDGYWVLAHVTPSITETGTLTGYHSNRRKPRADAVDRVRGLYRDLLGIEGSAPNRKDGLIASSEALSAQLDRIGVDYDQFVLAL